MITALLLGFAWGLLTAWELSKCATPLNWRDESLWLKKLVARLSSADNKRAVCALVAESMRERYRFIDEVLSKQREPE
jgi:gluconate kinase